MAGPTFCDSKPMAAWSIDTPGDRSDAASCGSTEDRVGLAQVLRFEANGFAVERHFG